MGHLFSRRKFMQSAAVGTAAIGLGWNLLEKSQEPFRVRALRLAPVFDAPNGAIVGHLPADSVLHVQASGAYFVSEHGLIAQTDMQPMIDIVRVPPEQAKPPFYVEVIDPSAALRAYAAPDAEILRKVGHGAFLQIIGTLPDYNGEMWYETSDHCWIEGHGLSLWTPPPISGESFKLVIEQRRGILSAEVNKKPFLQTPFAYAESDADARQVVCNSGEWIIQGAHRHNQFIVNPDAPSRIIEIPAGAARLLNGFAGKG